MRESAVVVGSDGTRIGDAVVRQGAMLAQAMGASLHVVTPAGDVVRGARAVYGWNVRIEMHPTAGDLKTAVRDVAERIGADKIVVDRTSSNRFGRAVAALRWRLAPNAPRPVRVIEVGGARQIEVDPMIDGPDSVDWVVAGP